MKKIVRLLFIIILIITTTIGCKKSENYILFEYDGFTIIRTRADNIKPETIRAPLCSDYVKDMGYYGINAGFFNSVFKEKPEDDAFGSVSISWSKEDANNGLEVCEYSKRDLELIALGEKPYISRGTLFLYQDDRQYEAGGNISRKLRRCKKTDESGDGRRIRLHIYDRRRELLS